MKFKIFAVLALIMVALGWRADAQTNLVPVIRTNLITAAKSFREVNGKLYNSERSILWTNFQGEFLKVLTNGLVVSTFTMEPIYQAATTTEFRHMGFDATPGTPVLVAKQVQVGENKVPGRKIILRNYPAELYPAVGQTITFRAMLVGTSDYSEDTLELWDYGTPHIVSVVTTNYQTLP